MNWKRSMMAVVCLGAIAACSDDEPANNTNNNTITDMEVDVPDMPSDVSDEDADMPADVPDMEADADMPDMPVDMEPGFATLVFTVDDSANKSYEASDGLAWKGSFSYDSATNLLTLNGAWAGPFVPLFDDGTHGDETAADGIWTAAVNVATPAAPLTFEYGAIRGSVDGSDGQWIWSGSNGQVTVPAGETGEVVATGLVIPAFGTIDWKLTLDVSANGANLAADFQGVSYTDVKVKSSAQGYVEVPLVDDGTKGDESAGDQVFTFVLSQNLDRNQGLLKAGEDTEFIFVLNGVEYRVEGAAAKMGANASLKTGADWTTTEIMTRTTGSQNLYVSP